MWPAVAVCGVAAGRAWVPAAEAVCACGAEPANTRAATTAHVREIRRNVNILRPPGRGNDNKKDGRSGAWEVQRRAMDRILPDTIARKPCGSIPYTPTRRRRSR